MVTITARTTTRTTVRSARIPLYEAAQDRYHAAVRDAYIWHRVPDYARIGWWALVGTATLIVGQLGRRFGLAVLVLVMLGGLATAIVGALLARP